MPYSDIYLYSPLSVKTVRYNQPLLLQFILSELFHAMDADKKDHPLEFVFSSPACFFPYDWSYEVGCLNKINEHAELLPHAFPDYPEEVEAFRVTLGEILSKIINQKEQNKPISKTELLVDLNLLFTLLEPFLIACNQSEHLLLFLLKHNEEIDELAKLATLLKKMAPEGLKNMAELMQREFKNRGFHALLPEIQHLVSRHER
ncbi:MAG: hypothetical protein JSS30_07530 [Verrucomicrobia bacterium]|nr:hypothetical protein [Verrucomicrobiota bacterium]